jgi:hypothetical protein
MPFVFLTFAVIVVVAVSAFFGTSPRVENRRALLAVNVAILALAIPAAAVVGWWIYVDASALKSGGRGMAAYFGIMSGGSAALLVIAVGGLVRNFVIFPRSKRIPAPAPVRA